MDKVDTEQFRVKTPYHLNVTAELTPDEEDGGYSVYCPELDIYTQGETITESIANLREAVEGYVDVTIPVPVHAGRTIKIGTLSGILRKAHISREQLDTLLKRR